MTENGASPQFSLRLFWLRLCRVMFSAVSARQLLREKRRCLA